ncbi:ABC transporter ATP-binding protein [Saccharicrinis sp. FJH54]|uniref:ABC transporter ATP-binding protein n=1 Tax=Saccharicrinis sp. FJH54 TaxID=3344665 RepID=UPI0035D4C8AA
MKVIDVHNLSFGYGTKKVLNNISFSLQQGRILGLLGPNGVGKSTLINILTGFLEADSGSAFIFGEPYNKQSVQSKRRTGYLIEGHIQYTFMNVTEAEKFYSRFYPKWNFDLYNSYITNAKIGLKQKIGTMSRGQRSKVALAIIMAQNPDLLILDDFSMGLDPVYRQMFINDLSDYARTNEKTVLATSHIIQDMEKLVDDVAIMDYNDFIPPLSLTDFKLNHKKLGSNLDDIFVNLFIDKI